MKAGSTVLVRIKLSLLQTVENWTSIHFNWSHIYRFLVDLHWLYVSMAFIAVPITAVRVKMFPSHKFTKETWQCLSGHLHTHILCQRPESLRVVGNVLSIPMTLSAFLDRDHHFCLVGQFEGFSPKCSNHHCHYCLFCFLHFLPLLLDLYFSWYFGMRLFFLGTTASASFFSSLYHSIWLVDQPKILSQDLNSFSLQHLG